MYNSIATLLGKLSPFTPKVKPDVPDEPAGASSSDDESETEIFVRPPLDNDVDAGDGQHETRFDGADA